MGCVHVRIRGGKMWGLFLGVFVLVQVPEKLVKLEVLEVLAILAESVVQPQLRAPVDCTLGLVSAFESLFLKFENFQVLKGTGSAGTR